MDGVTQVSYNAVQEQKFGVFFERWKKKKVVKIGTVYFKVQTFNSAQSHSRTGHKNDAIDQLELYNNPWCRTSW